MAKRYDSEFKDKAVLYYLNNLDLGVTDCARKLGISQNSLSRWIMEFKREHSDDYNTMLAEKQETLKKQIQEANEEIARLRAELGWRK